MTRAPARAILLLILLFSPSRESRGAQSFDGLTISAHLTQAYGTTDNGTLLGIPETGTTDLRKVALQFRWQPTDRTVFVVQIAHEDNGVEDPFIQETDSLVLDWAFFEYRFDEASAIKVGRLNPPIGIYNDVRDVGTLLPFFRLPLSFYADTNNSAETVDGVALAHTFSPRSPWSVETELFFGGWHGFDTLPGASPVDARAENGLGLQLWINTPLPGLRMGLGALDWKVSGGFRSEGLETSHLSLHASLDGSFDKWYIRSEYRLFEFELDAQATFGLPFPLVIEGVTREGFYAQLGYWVTEKLSVTAQYDRVELGAALPFSGPIDLHDDIALSVGYHFKPNLLLKLEYHASETGLSSEATSPIDGGEPVDLQPEAHWTILSFSASF